MTKLMWPSFLLFFLFLTSCQSNLALHVIAHKNINPDLHRHTSAPVSIQIYQLKDKQKFLDASFFQIIDSPEKLLSPDFIGNVSSFMIIPTQNRDLSIFLDSDTKYVGIIAAFQEIDNSNWKILIPLEGRNKSNIKIEINNRSITVK